MKLFIILILSSLCALASANDKALVNDVTNTLEEVSSGSHGLQDCPEAKNHESLINQCRSVGVEKVISQGKSFGVEIRPQDVKVCEVDARFFSVAKYVWFCANSSKGQISKIVQKPLFGKCF